MTRFPPKDQLIIGLHALREVLLHAPNRLLAIFTEKKEFHASRKHEILALAQKQNIPIHFASYEQLTQIAGTDSHQSFAAHIRSRAFLSPKQFLTTAKESSLVLLLDQIFDPQNFGAILRSAEALGADAIVWSKNRGADLTPIVSKASCGASEILPLIRVSNLAEAASQFQKAGFELVTATLHPSAETLYQFSPAPRTLLVVGSEGEGIQPLIQKRADRSVSIPMRGHIASLNVAQATSILLTWLLRGRL